MPIYREYLDKQATLILDNEYSNASHDPVLELTRKDKINSRFVFEIDLSKIQDRLSSKEINNVESFKLKFINTIRFRNELIGKDFYEGIRDTQFTLNLYQLNEDFTLSHADQEYNYDPDTSKLIKIYPNWYNKDENNTWDSNGALDISGETTLSSQEFVLGNEDLELDVTTYITDVIECATGDTKVRFLLSYSPDDEAYTGDTRFSVGFHSKFTNTVYEPYLEVNYDDTIIDERCNFYIGKRNKLVLANYVGGRLQNLDNKPESVLIIDNYDEEIFNIPQSGITHESKGVYSVDVMLKDFPDLVNFKDKWTGIVYNSIKLPDYEQKFTLYDINDYYSNEIRTVGNNNNNIMISFEGINYDEKVFNDEKRQILVNIDSIYPIEQFVELYYRIYSKQSDNQYEILPYTRISRLDEQHFFKIDTSFYVPNEYFIDFKIKSSGNEFVRQEILAFEVVGEILT